MPFLYWLIYIQCFGKLGIIEGELFKDFWTNTVFEDTFCLSIMTVF